MKLLRRLLLLLFSFPGSSLLNLILADPPSYPSYVTTHQDWIMNYRAQQVILFQNNTEIAIPFLISIKNYGVLLDNFSLTRAGSETNIDMEFPGDSKIQLLKEFNPAAGTVTWEGSLASTTEKGKQFTLIKTQLFLLTKCLLYAKIKNTKIAKSPIVDFYFLYDAEQFCLCTRNKNNRCNIG